MERLTMNNGICQMASTEFCLSQKDCYSCPHGRKCFKRLAAYEDTEREPEEIKAILERYHAFRSAISDETGQPMVSWTRAGEICRAEKDGRLVVQKHGEWETHLLPLAWECSVCGFKNSFRTGRTTEYLNYCPCCGAKMDEEVDNEAD